MKRNLEIAISVFGTLALIAQLYIMLSIRSAQGESIWIGIVNYLSFFTILTNIAVAKAVSVPLIMPKSFASRFFQSPIILGALAVYIFIVGMIYVFVLKDLWNPQGLQLWVDAVLHYIIPVLFIIYWLNYVPKKKLVWFHSIVWLIPPFVYIAYTLIRGNLTGYYPYPFLDVDRIGIATVLYNSAGMSFLFWVTGMIFIAIDRRSSRS